MDKPIRGNTHILDAPYKIYMPSTCAYITKAGFYSIEEVIDHITAIEFYTRKYPSFSNRKYMLIIGEEIVFEWQRENIGIYDQLRQFLHNIELSMENEATAKHMVC